MFCSPQYLTVPAMIAWGLAATAWHNSDVVCLGGERFPFVVPGDDTAPSATSLAYLSPKPAGADGFVRMQDGHFATGAGRLKIWGVNTCFGANFPAREEAEKIAAHLAKLGVNGVRMHHHDNGAAPRGVWGKIVDGKRTFDPQQLDRQDYFLHQLHQHGIYANLNLHVSRTFTEQEGFLGQELPRAVRYDKYLLYFEPRMRALFKDFCRQYLTHENPYRKLRRVDDPGIAMIEITNENAFSREGAGVAASLPEPYRGEFQRQWNAWLAKRYPSTSALKDAWGARIEPLGAVLADSTAWTENLGAWRLRSHADSPVQSRFREPGPEPGRQAVRLEIAKAAPETQQHELQCPDLTLEPGKTYTLSLWIKADSPRTVHLDVSRQGPNDWSSLGFRESLQVGDSWQKVVRVFRASESIPGPARICFKFGGSDIDFSLADVSLQRGGAWIVVPDGQSVEQQNVEIPVAGWCEPALQDVRHFMVDTEKGFIRDIVNFLKTDLGARVPITASQITYHEAAIVAETCDYADIHAYWQHPRFPRRPWDPVDWTISNTPMEEVPDQDRLLACAPWRLIDRPFTISEWNIPDPHDYAASVVPFAAMVASLQDWDAVFFFQYHGNEQDWWTDRVQRYFSFNGQPVKLTLLAACAHMFRRGDLAPLDNTAHGTLEQRLPATLGLSHRIGIDPRATTVSAAVVPAGKRLASPDGRVVWDASDANRAHVLINAPASRALWGRVAEQTFDLGGIELALGKTDRNYAALVLTSQDGRPLEQSKRILFAAVGSAENQDMGWNEDRTSVGNQWGTAPALVNGIPAKVSLPFRAQRVTALDGRGLPAQEVPLRFADGKTQFDIGPQYRTLWYEIGVE